MIAKERENSKLLKYQSQKTNVTDRSIYSSKTMHSRLNRHSDCTKEVEFDPYSNLVNKYYVK